MKDPAGAGCRPGVTMGSGQRPLPWVKGESTQGAAWALSPVTGASHRAGTDGRALVYLLRCVLATALACLWKRKPCSPAWAVPAPPTPQQLGQVWKVGQSAGGSAPCSSAGTPLTVGSVWRGGRGQAGGWRAEGEGLHSRVSYSDVVTCSGRQQAGLCRPLSAMRAITPCY